MATDRRLRRRSVLVAMLAVLAVVAAGAVAGATPGPGDAGRPATDVGGAGGPVAQTDEGAGGNQSRLDICDRNASTFVGAFNSEIEDVPGLVKGRIRDTDVYLDVEGAAGGDYGLETNADSQVTGYSEGKPESATVRVVTDCRTFRNITDAGDPGQQFRTAYNNDRIRFIGLTVTNWLFFGAAATVTDPLSLAVVLLLFAVALVLVYVAYRRVTLHYRGGGSEAVPAGEQEAPGGQGDAPGGQGDAPGGQGGAPGGQGDAPGGGQGPPPDAGSGREQGNSGRDGRQ